MKITQSLQLELERLQSEVRAHAASAKLRIHLFQLLALMGNWSRALSQLQVCAQLDAKALPMAQTYREAIRCELFRRDVFEGRRTPQIMGTPPPWAGMMIEALKFDAAKDYARASELRSSAMEFSDAAACQIDGVACEWVADGDSRLGPTLEVIANGQYYWLPLQSCTGIALDPPTDLRDLVWAPGEVILPNEGRVAVLVPTRYPGTELNVSAEADDLKCARRTEWAEQYPGMWFGTGQRVWISDVGEHAILDTRKLMVGEPTNESPSVVA